MRNVLKITCFRYRSLPKYYICIQFVNNKKLIKNDRCEYTTTRSNGFKDVKTETPPIHFVFTNRRIS